MPDARSSMQRPADTKPTKWWAFVLAGLANAACNLLSFPPFTLWPLALLAIIPLVWAGCRAHDRPKRAALFAALGTLPFWTYQHLWMWNVAPAGTATGRTTRWPNSGWP